MGWFGSNCKGTSGLWGAGRDSCMDAIRCGARIISSVAEQCGLGPGSGVYVKVRFVA